MNSLIFEQKRKVSSAFIDSKVQLGIHQAVLMVQDNLTECFDMMKCDGVRFREFNAFWVFTKSSLRFLNFPKWKDEIYAKTFPVSCTGFRTNVNTVLSDTDENPLVIANQEACVLSMESHRPVKLSTLPYPSENFPEAAFKEPFERFDINDNDYKPEYEYTIRSQNIDMSHHMNNIEYIKLAMNIFSDEYIQVHNAKSLEVHYLNESKEGQTLSVFSKQTENSTFVKIKEGARDIFEMKISF
ncbi:MAG: hypothetical protein K6G00_09830 [Treponema sp.]|nr:hypothetical protein [Treponema sp.]